MKAIGRLVRLNDLSPCRRDEMFALMDTHYQDMSRSEFDADLANKEWIIEVEDATSGRLAGFSTLRMLMVPAAGRIVRAVFSGDTIIDKDAWGQQQLFQISGWFLRSLMEAFPEEPLYWFLISKGYKTYRFLPVFFKSFFPRFDRPTPVEIVAVIDALGGTIAPGRYDPRTGIIRNDQASYRLRPGVADLEAPRLDDPHIQFFATRNPRHADGDELCCVAPLWLDNFTRAAFRAMGPMPPESVVEFATQLAPGSVFASPSGS